MAEPLHRIAPPGASTGQSVRRYDKTYVRQVRDICLHYVKKTSGLYENNVAAARYVHQMADEVLSQLRGVTEEIRRNTGEPEALQALLDEWRESFPESLGNFGSPRAIASRLMQQDKELRDLREKLRIASSAHDSDLSQMLQSMDTQLHSYRDGVMKERAQQTFTQCQLKSDMERSLQEVMQNASSALELKDLECKKITQDLRDRQETELRRKQKEYSALQSDIKSQEMSYQNQINRIAREKDTEIDSLHSKLNKLKDKYYDLLNRAEDGDAIDDLSEVSAPVNRGGPESSAPSRRRNRRDDHLPKISTEVQRMIEDLNNRINELSTLNIHQSECIDKLKERSDGLFKAKKATEKRIFELEEINEAMRRALAMKLHTEGTYSKIGGSKDISASPFPLNHTPHFLGRPDRNGTLNSHPTMTGYNTAGIF